MFHKTIFSILLNLILCTISIVHSSYCVASEYQISPLPQWVDSVIVNNSQAHPEGNDVGIEHLLLDIQTKVEPNSITSFEHKVKKILKSESLQDIANIEIGFHPENENITLHQVSIHRGSKTFNQIKAKNIKVLQREKRLEDQVFTGEKSLLIFLEDLRVGDILEYSFSIENRDPRRLKDFYQGLYNFGYSPLAQMRYRLLWPKDRPLAIKNHNTDIAPKIKDNGNEKEYIWEFKNLYAVQLEQDTPAWYSPGGWIEIGTELTWNDVARTQSKDYKVPEKTSKDLKLFISDIVKKYKNPNDQFIAAIRFIQDEIRYLSVSDQTYLPADPATVFQRRYGDCQDKALLALTILKGLGVKALAALVETREGKVLNELLPRYSAFNHVIIVVDIDGKQYWFDPTSTFERGNLEHLTQPDYGYALVLDPQTTALTQFPPALPAASSHTVFETIDLSQGFESPALFNVKTIYKGKYANINRESIYSMDTEKTKSKYLDYYKKHYPSIVEQEGFEITDDPEKNEITVVESYKIENPGVPNQGGKSLNFWHNVNELNAYLKEDIGLPRTMPFSLIHPVLFIKNIEILLPEQEWEIKPEKVMVNDSAFNFMKSEQFKNNKYSVFYQYFTHNDHVKAEKASEYIENVNKMKEALGGGLNNPSPIDSINWPVLMLSIVLSIIFIFICFKIYFYKPTAKIDEGITPKGIGGWLVLVAIGMVLSPFQGAKEVAEYFSIIHSMNAWDILSNPTGADFHPMRAPYLLSLLFVLIAEEIFCILLLFLFFKKKRMFPILYIVFAWVTLILLIFYELSSKALFNEPITEHYTIAAMLIGSIVWTAYFLRSKRVKATFIK